ncbi:MAG: hypothetical protein F6K23_27705 [Okeania sp. SIO2C9]|uniref:hypothetical protein n=1 Tax=Okeania sp. SIO2C9 TaxID=2607791 RepID=UPI0013C1B12E|nr:hypothetical protein [Okeania sp. SIO2C9]NEQ76487.1 hypothetical protein [Okeania sp. SIO2C9]
MKITGEINVAVEAEVRAPARKVGNEARFGVGEHIRVFPLESLSDKQGIIWKIKSGGGSLVHDLTKGLGVATYIARDLEEDELKSSKRSYEVVLELMDNSKQLAQVEFTVIAPKWAGLLKLGPRHEQGYANSGFWGIWVLGPKDVSFMNVVIKESLGTINSSGTMSSEKGTIHKISGGNSHVDHSGDWMDSMVMTDRGTVFDAIDNVWSPSETPKGGWRNDLNRVLLPVGKLEWDIAQMYKLKTDTSDKGLQYGKAWHKASVTIDGTMTTEKGGAKHVAKINDPTVNFEERPSLDMWEQEIPQAVKDWFRSPVLSSAQVFNYALSNEPIMLNGMKVIFDHSAPVYPVTLQPKDK